MPSRLMCSATMSLRILSPSSSSLNFRTGNAPIDAINQFHSLTYSRTRPCEIDSARHLCNNSSHTRSPDGSKLAFSSNRAGSTDECEDWLLLSRPGPRRQANRRHVTAGPKIDTRPAVSPDGSRLVFQSNRDGKYEFYVMKLH